MNSKLKTRNSKLKAKAILLILTFLMLPSLVWAKEWVVGAGDSIIIRIKDITRIAIGNPDIADAAMVSPEEILINGKKGGETSLHVWVPTGIIPHRIRVLEDSLPIHEIRKIEGLEAVRAYTLKESIVLSGEVRTKEKAAIAEKLAHSFGKEVVNLIRITEPLSDLKKVEGLEMVATQMIGDTLILKGEVATEAEVQLARSLAESEYERVISLIKVIPNLKEAKSEKEIEIYRGIVKEEKIIKPPLIEEHESGMGDGDSGIEETSHDSLTTIYEIKEDRQK
ncbi:MAG: pilus assembly protein N-terminal domain-containing protein [bacterium]